MYDTYIVKDSEKLRQIEEALLASYFKNYDQDFLSTETGKEDIKANVYRRYNKALQHAVPWVAKQIDLQGKTLVEIGSGTGSSTAAFAHFVEKIDGYDIDEQALAGARARLEVSTTASASGRPYSLTNRCFLGSGSSGNASRADSIHASSMTSGSSVQPRMTASQPAATASQIRSEIRSKAASAPSAQPAARRPCTWPL